MFPEVGVGTKLAFAGAGLLLFMFMYTPPTPEAASNYLAGQGYTDVEVQDRFTICGSKGKRQYEFRAQTSNGRIVSGKICMNDFGGGSVTLHAR